MRFTSLIVELVRAKPRLIFWIVVLAQAALWFLLPVLVYDSPPGDVATVLAVGREYQVGSYFGPPLAFWLADVAFRITGNHVFGVYLLAQACFAVTAWAIFALSRAVVGGQQAILAVLLTVTIFAFSFPGVEFGPSILARPLWALVLLHAWQVMGQGRRNAWFALSIEAGLLLLTTYAAIPLLVMLAIFALATPRGRRAVASSDAVFAVVVITVLVLPFLIWRAQHGGAIAVTLPSVSALPDRLSDWASLFGAMLFGLSGIALLLIFNSRWLNRKPEEAPVIYRPPLDPFARLFVYVLALAPPLVLSLLSALGQQGEVTGGDGIALMLSGLAVIVAAGDLIYLRRQQVLRTVWLFIIVVPAIYIVALALIQPWLDGAENRTALPATAIGRFFDENFSRRVGRPLASVAGDPQIATLIGFAAPARPHVLFDENPERTPWLTPAGFAASGGVVVWRATDTAGTPPAELAKRFPGLVPEVPRIFDRQIKGRLAPLRIGWAIVRPQGVPPAPR